MSIARQEVGVQMLTEVCHEGWDGRLQQLWVSWLHCWQMSFKLIQIGDISETSKCRLKRLIGVTVRQNLIHEYWHAHLLQFGEWVLFTRTALHYWEVLISVTWWPNWSPWWFGLVVWNPWPSGITPRIPRSIPINGKYVGTLVQFRKMDKLHIVNSLTRISSQIPATSWVISWVEWSSGQKPLLWALLVISFS